MHLEEITLALFAACNSIRIFAYVPQIHKAATDSNGASAISGTTWSLFLVAHLSTIAHALVNLSDGWLAACFTANALCCVAILGIAYCKKRRHGFRVAERDDCDKICGASGTGSGLISQFKGIARSQRFCNARPSVASIDLGRWRFCAASVYSDIAPIQQRRASGLDKATFVSQAREAARPNCGSCSRSLRVNSADHRLLQ